jgi:hypothetical protein
MGYLMFWTQGLHLESLHQHFLWWVFFEIGSHELFCLGWLWTAFLLISASWVARIAGISHQHWTLIMVLIYIALITNGGHVMCLLIFCLFSSEECLFEYFAHLLIGLFVFLLLSCKNSLYSLMIHIHSKSRLSLDIIYKCLFPFLGYLFTLLTVFFYI